MLVITPEQRDRLEIAAITQRIKVCKTISDIQGVLEQAQDYVKSLDQDQQNQVRIAEIKQRITLCTTMPDIRDVLNQTCGCMKLMTEDQIIELTDHVIATASLFIDACGNIRDLADQSSCITAMPIPKKRKTPLRDAIKTQMLCIQIKECRDISAIQGVLSRLAPKQQERFTDHVIATATQIINRCTRINELLDEANSVNTLVLQSGTDALKALITTRSLELISTCDDVDTLRNIANGDLENGSLDQDQQNQIRIAAIKRRITLCTTMSNIRDVLNAANDYVRSLKQDQRAEFTEHVVTKAIQIINDHTSTLQNDSIDVDEMPLEDTPKARLKEKITERACYVIRDSETMNILLTQARKIDGMRLESDQKFQLKEEATRKACQLIDGCRNMSTLSNELLVAEGLLLEENQKARLLEQIITNVDRCIETFDQNTDLGNQLNHIRAMPMITQVQKTHFRNVAIAQCITVCTNMSEALHVLVETCDHIGLLTGEERVQCEDQVTSIIANRFINACTNMGELREYLTEINQIPPERNLTNQLKSAITTRASELITECIDMGKLGEYLTEVNQMPPDPNLITQLKSEITTHASDLITGCSNIAGLQQYLENIMEWQNGNQKEDLKKKIENKIFWQQAKIIARILLKDTVVAAVAISPLVIGALLLANAKTTALIAMSEYFVAQLGASIAAFLPPGFVVLGAVALFGFVYLVFCQQRTARKELNPSGNQEQAEVLQPGGEPEQPLAQPPAQQVGDRAQPPAVQPEQQVDDQHNQPAQPPLQPRDVMS